MRWTTLAKPFLIKVRDRQPEALDTIKKHGFVFDNLDDRWQKLAFSLYTDLVELSHDATHILEVEAEPEAREHE